MGSYAGFVYLRLAGFEFTTADVHAEHMMSMDFVETVDGTGNAVFEIYDDTAYEVENALLSTEDVGRTAEWWFGYHTGEQSAHYTGVVTEFYEEFTGTGMTLTIGVTATGTYQSAVGSTMDKIYEGTSEQIINQIAAEEGWDLECYPTDGTVLTLKRDAGVTAESFIRAQVIPQTIASDGKMNYHLALKSTSEGLTAKFRPTEVGEIVEGFNFTVGSPHEDIISWSITNAQGLYAYYGTGGWTNSCVKPNGEYTTVYGVSNSTRGTVHRDYSTPDAVNMTKNYILNSMNGAWSYAFQAELVLKGRVSIDVGEHIGIRVLNKYGMEHFTSGKYFIESAEHMIEGGKFQTKLSLIKVDSMDITITEDTCSISEYAGRQNNGTSTMVPGELIGEFTITGYCTCKICCGNYSPEVTGKPAHTASGATPVQGVTIAADWSVLPKGTQVMFEGPSGMHTYTVQDKGGAVKGNHIDLFFNSHQDAVKWGKQMRPVYRANAVAAVSDGGAATPEGVPDNFVSRACQGYLGIPYVWGAKGPNAYDCSGFACALINQLGGNISGGTATLVGVGTAVTGGIANAQPGDLLVRRNGDAGHVQVYVGNGWACHAPGAGKVVCFTKAMTNYTSIRRVL